MTLRGVISHHALELVPSFVKRGLRVTTLARTFVDIAPLLSEERLEFALDTARLRNSNLGRWLETYLDSIEHRGRSGLATLVRLLALRKTGSTESPLEVRVWRALRRNGLNDVSRQFVVRDVMRIDFAWPRHRVALHTDSTLWHLQEERLTRDAHQRMQLQELGWMSLVVTNSMLNAGDAWLMYVRTQLRQREPQLTFSAGARHLKSPRS